MEDLGRPMETARAVDGQTAGQQPSMCKLDRRAFVDRYLPALLAQAGLLISTDFHAIVKAHGLSVSEWRVLSTLADSESMSIGHLAQVAVTKQPTATRLLDRMEAQGHVERASHDTDRRVTMVRITSTGRRIVWHLVARAEIHERSVLQSLGTKRANELREILRGLIRFHRPPTGT
jgi:DNA-binding MarR family transcriptional regulator